MLFAVFAAFLAVQKEVCLKINGKQCVKLRDGSIKFNNYSKQLVVLFKIYGEFEFLLKGVGGIKVVMLPIPKNIKRIFVAVLLIKLCIDDRFSKSGKNAVNKFIEAILKEYVYCKLVIKSTLTLSFGITFIFASNLPTSCIIK